jgi:hypothetical protein
MTNGNALAFAEDMARSRRLQTIEGYRQTVQEAFINRDSLDAVIVVAQNRLKWV